MEDAVCSRLFWGWLIARTLLWTLVATLTQPNAPLDVIEWLYWGHEWCWGYHKHPPFPAWVAECCALLTPGSLAAIYLASYVCVGACMAAVWRLGREMLPPRHALLAALALEGVSFYSFAAAEFNNNVVLNATSALAVLSLYRALRSGRNGWWLATGLTLGLGLLSKYTAVFLIGPMVLFLLAHPEARRCWRMPGPYLAGAAALLLFTPHLVWMIQHDFPTLHYARTRFAGTGHWSDHLRFPIGFCSSQLLRLLPLLMVVLPLARWPWRTRPVAGPEKFNRDFLAWMVLGPVALHLLVSLATGRHLRAIWGAQLWAFAGLLLVVSLELRTSARSVAWAGRRLGLVAVLVLAGTVARNYLGPGLTKEPSRIHFPGQALADEVVRRWQERHGGPIPLVAGDWWLAGNISCYAPHRPSVYPALELNLFKPDPRAAVWTSDEDLRRRGGVLLWDAGRYGTRKVPRALRARFPAAELQPSFALPYQCRAPVPPVRVGMAFIPPARQAAPTVSR
jgi:4-amino-4-deoxy-L-arabinose transferase-like glycosyltransferase